MRNFQMQDAFVDGLLDRDEKIVKTASEGYKSLIKSRLFENGILRRLFKITHVTRKDLDVPEGEELYRWIEKDSLEGEAASFNLTNRSDMDTYSGERFKIRYFKIGTPEYVKSEIQLMTYRNDLRKLLEEKIPYAIDDREDIEAFGQFRIMVGETDSVKYNTTETNKLCNVWWNEAKEGGAGYSPVVGASDATVQTYIFGSTDKVTPVTVGHGIDLMIAKKLRPFAFLCHEKFYGQQRKWTALEYGDKVVEERVMQNLYAQTNKKLLTIPCVTTLKDHVIPTNELWIVTEQKFFGVFEQLEDLKFFANMYEDGHYGFKAHEYMGFSVGNTKGLIRLIFNMDVINSFETTLSLS
jgi:hypothetical protein